MGLELDILNGLHALSCAPLDAVMLCTTYAVTGGLLWFVLASGMLLVPGRRRAGAVLVAAVLCAYLVSDVLLKPLVGRTRPCGFADFELLVPVPDSYSFPSGHTMSTFAAVTVLSAVFGRWKVPLFAFGCAVGLSRLYLFVHWPTDVLVGAVLGMAVAAVVIRVSAKSGFADLWRPGEERTGAGAP